MLCKSFAKLTGHKDTLADKGLQDTLGKDRIPKKKRTSAIYGRFSR